MQNGKKMNSSAFNDDGRAVPSILEDIRRWSNDRGGQPWLVESWSERQRIITWKEATQLIDSVASWLLAVTNGRKCSVGLLAPNCAHWILADFAIMASGNVTVPIFTSMDSDTVEYLAELTKIRIVFVGAAANWKSVKDRLGDDVIVVSLPDAPEMPDALSWENIVEQGSELDSAPPPPLDSVATIVFTSGTTGRPKGVMHSLTSLNEAAHGNRMLAESRVGCRFFSYLPLAHLAERVLVECHSVVCGGTIHFSESVETFLPDLREARPNYILGVPRIWEKLQQAVFSEGFEVKEIGNSQNSRKQYEEGESVRDFLGLTEIDYIMTATAPTPTPLKEWYSSLGLDLREGYGQSEILPISGVRKHDQDHSSVGKAVPGVEIKIAQDGEILARGGGTALGYYKEAQKTEETFGKNGWVFTGDKGRLDEQGNLYITGRVKEIFKTSKGRYVAPAPIEGAFLESPLIHQACLTGHGHTQTIMMAVVEPSSAHSSTDRTLDEVKAWITELNHRLENHEKIGACILSYAPWTQESGELTHTLKLKRDVIEAKFEEHIKSAGELMRQGKSLFVTMASPL
jgi:long-subunit acyl-CoA synthetase (AMP-forming)